MINDRYIYHHASKRISILRKTHLHLTLNRQDWEDLEQDILIHVFKKFREHYDNSGRYKAFVNRIVQNQFTNWCRDHFHLYEGKRKDKKLCKFWRAVRFPSRIYTRIEQHGLSGDEIVYEPDVAVETDSTRTSLLEIISELPKGDCEFIRSYLEYGCWQKTGGNPSLKQMRSYNKARRRGMKIAKEIRERFRHGEVAQSEERLHGMQEATGSKPVFSTNFGT